MSFEEIVITRPIVETISTSTAPSFSEKSTLETDSGTIVEEFVSVSNVSEDEKFEDIYVGVEEEVIEEEGEEEVKKEKETEKGKMSKMWDFVKKSAKSLWDWGDYFGEKIAWQLGITSSRFQDQIVQAEDLLHEASEGRDIETGNRFGVSRNMPDFNKFPESLLDHVYKKGISVNQNIFDISKIKRVDNLFDEESSNESENSNFPVCSEISSEEDLLPLLKENEEEVVLDDL